MKYEKKEKRMQSTYKYSTSSGVPLDEAQLKGD
jgi:hypothetical protein